MFLAGDVGGTKTLVGLFAPASPRPLQIETREFRTVEFPDLGSIVDAFLRDTGGRPKTLLGACFGVAGPVERGRARLTNVPWIVEAEVLRRQIPVVRADLINDLEALAWSVPTLDATELATLWSGQADELGGMALIAAGTG